MVGVTKEWYQNFWLPENGFNFQSLFGPIDIMNTSELPFRLWIGIQPLKPNHKAVEECPLRRTCHKFWKRVCNRRKWVTKLINIEGGNQCSFQILWHSLFGPDIEFDQLDKELRIGLIFFRCAQLRKPMLIDFIECLEMKGDSNE